MGKQGQRHPETERRRRHCLRWRESGEHPRRCDRHEAGWDSRQILTSDDKENLMSTKNDVKDQIDQLADKAKDAAGKVADKAKDAAHKTGESLKDAGEKVKHSAD